jgi:hypothetical protein
MRRRASDEVWAWWEWVEGDASDGADEEGAAAAAEAWWEELPEAWALLPRSTTATTSISPSLLSGAFFPWVDSFALSRSIVSLSRLCALPFVVAAFAFPPFGVPFKLDGLGAGLWLLELALLVALGWDECARAWCSGEGGAAYLGVPGAGGGLGERSLAAERVIRREGVAEAGVEGWEPVILGVLAVLRRVVGVAGE